MENRTVKNPALALAAAVYFAIAVIITLLAPAASAFAPANLDDQQTAQFYSRQCPGCTLTGLQFFNNQKRLALAKTKITLKPGFYTVDQPEIPSKVKQASKAVFSLIVLNEDENTYPEIFSHVLEEKFRTWSQAPEAHTRRVAQVAKIYLDQCKAESKALCRAPLKVGAIAGGSGLLLGESGTEMWTAGHVFEEPFRQALQKIKSNDVQELVRRQMSFKVLIFDAENRLVAHPFNNKMKLVYSASAEIVPRANPTIQIDNLRFELEKSLGKGLEIAPAIKPGTNVYSVGYPSCTGCAQKYGSIEEKLLSGTRFPYRDASNFDHQVTLGQVLDQEGTVITTNADAQGGMSGGAALDEEGRVLGINSAVGVSVKSPDFLTDRRLRLSRPTVWTALVQTRS